jgi:hypothetical protein
LGEGGSQAGGGFAHVVPDNGGRRTGRPILGANELGEGGPNVSHDIGIQLLPHKASDVIGLDYR